MATAEGILESAPMGGETELVLILDPWRLDGGPWNEGWFYVVVKGVPRSAARGFRTGSGVRVSGKKGRGLRGGNYPWLAGKLPLEKAKLDTKRTAPERLDDAVLGRLERDESMGWVSWRKFEGSEYELSLAVGVAKDLARARKVVTRTWKALPSLRAKAAKHVGVLYAKTRGPGPRLTPAQVARRTSKLRSMQVESSGVTLMFDGGGLFGDHAVQVVVSTTGKLRVSLA